MLLPDSPNMSQSLEPGATRSNVGSKDGQGRHQWQLSIQGSAGPAAQRLEQGWCPREQPVLSGRPCRGSMHHMQTA